MGRRIVFALCAAELGDSDGSDNASRARMGPQNKVPNLLKKIFDLLLEGEWMRTSKL